MLQISSLLFHLCLYMHVYLISKYLVPTGGRIFLAVTTLACMEYKFVFHLESCSKYYLIRFLSCYSKHGPFHLTVDISPDPLVDKYRYPFDRRPGAIQGRSGCSVCNNFPTITGDGTPVFHL